MKHVGQVGAVYDKLDPNHVHIFCPVGETDPDFENEGRGRVRGPVDFQSKGARQAAIESRSPETKRGASANRIMTKEEQKSISQTITHEEEDLTPVKPGFWSC